MVSITWLWFIRTNSRISRWQPKPLRSWNAVSRSIVTFWKATTRFIWWLFVPETKRSLLLIRISWLRLSLNRIMRLRLPIRITNIISGWWTRCRIRSTRRPMQVTWRKIRSPFVVIIAMSVPSIRWRICCLSSCSSRRWPMCRLGMLKVSKTPWKHWLRNIRRLMWRNWRVKCWKVFCVGVWWFKVVLGEWVGTCVSVWGMMVRCRQPTRHVSLRLNLTRLTGCC